MLDDARQEKAVRLLAEATKDLLRFAAEMRERGIDTSPLSRPIELLAETIRDLSEPRPPEPKS